MHILSCLKSLSDSTGIVYPHKAIHDSKDGFGNYNSSMPVISITEIVAAVERGKKAQHAIEDFGMKSLLVKKECWDSPPFAGMKRTDDKLDDGDINEFDENSSDEDDICMAAVEDIGHEPSLLEDSADAAEITKGIAILSDNKVIGSKTVYHLSELHAKLFK